MQQLHRSTFQFLKYNSQVMLSISQEPSMRVFVDLETKAKLRFLNHEGLRVWFLTNLEIVCSNVSIANNCKRYLFQNPGGFLVSLETSKIKGCYACYFLNILLQVKMHMVNVCSQLCNSSSSADICMQRITTPTVSEFTLSCNDPMETLYNMFRHNYMQLLAIH